MEEWERLNVVIETSDGGYAIAGDIFDWFIGDGLIWVIKTNNYGIIPEFPSWIILPLFVLATLTMICVKCRRLLKNRFFLKIIPKTQKQRVRVFLDEFSF